MVALLPIELSQRINTTYTESPTANYRMNTADATRNSRKTTAMEERKKERKGIKGVAIGDGFYYKYHDYLAVLT